MPSSTSSTQFQDERDREIWQNLKEAIANSSGFARWQLENDLSRPQSREALEEQVRAYLRDTLATLAY